MPRNDYSVIIRAPTLKQLVKSVKGQPKRLESNIYQMLDPIGKAAKARIRVNVSGAKPYGTGYPDIPPIVKRDGRVFRSIDYRRTKKARGPSLVVGAIAGTRKGRMMAYVHDQGATITPVRHEFLVYPPFGTTIARNPASGKQFLTFRQAVARYNTWFISKKNPENILFKRTADSKPELGFKRKESVDIPARGIISREASFVEDEIQKNIGQAIVQSITNRAARFDKLKIRYDL